ncbi:MAG: hypothetical protein ACYDAE_12730 [Steroidobacteraceae bacterium]
MASARSTVLLLTATIDPGATPFVERRDPLLRLADYKHALEWWLSCGAVSRLVFCENSGFDLAPLDRLAARQRRCAVEFISFQGNQAAAVKGKGYGELQLIGHALATSSQIAASDVVAKCNGRLTVENATELFRAVESAEFDVMCTLMKCLSYADSRIYAATPAFVRQHLLPRLDMINDEEGVNAEHALACAAASAIASRMAWRPLPVYPRLVGVSASTGFSAADPPAKQAVRAVYHRLRRLAYER